MSNQYMVLQAHHTTGELITADSAREAAMKFIEVFDPVQHEVWVYEIAHSKPDVFSRETKIRHVKR